MKRILLTAAALALALPAMSADVGVSISIGEPGFYGRLDIGDFPPPALVYARPVVIAPSVGYVAEPMYLHVPPGHYRSWGRYCSYYQACGRPVYFVQDRWYNNVYVPQYRQRHNGRGDNGRGDMGGKGRGRGHDH